MTGPIDGDALLAKIRPQLKEHREQICLRPDLVDEFNELELALREEQIKSVSAGGSSGRLNPSKAPDDPPATPEAKRIARKIGTLEKQIADASVWFTFRALSKAEYQALCTEHPPRKDNQFDLIRGYNIQAVSDALVRRSLIDPVFTDEGWVALQASIGESEWTALTQGADAANSVVKTPGKSELASLIRSRRGSNSE